MILLIPLPMGMVKLISPSTYTLYSETIGIVDPVSWVSLSINKKATLAELFRYLSYAGIYLLTVQLLSHRYFLKKTVNYLAIFATLLGLIAILQGRNYQPLYIRRALFPSGYPETGDLSILRHPRCVANFFIADFRGLVRLEADF